MDPATLRKLLENVRKGTLSPARALDELARLPFETAGPALVDHHRALRQHLPEVILAQGKTVTQCVTIARAVVKKSGRCLATRVNREQAEALLDEFGAAAAWNEAARVVAIETRRPRPRRVGKAGGTRAKVGEPVLVISAGTSDVPVAEEAVATLEFMGVPVTRVYDAGVAGIHRLVAHVKALRSAAAIVVVAGMEGALASVVAGLTDRPVIAVPTSVGYGASYGGLAALLAMLNSCVAGVTVVNIDNGFGAGYAAGVIARQSRHGRRPR
ncbi:MAG TPA: nickel pincer cofactor biosynthesis protein LarB [Candidatus Eisenbacteria bacterium]|nr:nickel pincer cofactor biosynthesis protein LarB [Candidatus Eisenbacteria bacterium]